jgi:uncharacterized membrane protein
MLKTLLITNWGSTLLGVIAGLLAVLPVLQQWVQQTTHITPMALLGLIVGILGVLTREKPSTAK